MKLPKRIGLTCLVAFLISEVWFVALGVSGTLWSNWGLAMILAAINNISLYGGIICIVWAIILACINKKEVA